VCCVQYKAFRCKAEGLFKGHQTGTYCGPTGWWANTVQCATVQCATVQCATVQRATVQRATVQRATVQRATVQRATQDTGRSAAYWTHCAAVGGYLMLSW
jgi:hypothetical protein